MSSRTIHPALARKQERHWPRCVGQLDTYPSQGQNGGNCFFASMTSTASFQSLSRKLVWSFGVLLLVLLALLGYALLNFQKLSQAEGWRSHTYLVLLESQRAKEALFQMDADTRGYFLSGKPEEMSGYQTASQTFDEHIREMRRLTADNPPQGVRLMDIAKQEKKWKTNLLEPAIATCKPSDSLSVAVAKITNGALPRRDALENIRVSLSGFEDVEKSLLTTRVTRQEHLRFLTQLTLWIGSGFAVLLTALLALAAVRAVREANGAYEQVRQTNEQLGEANEQLQTAQSGLQLEVSQRRSAEENLRRVVGELKRSNAELEQFAYVASHDLQEPLRAVAGCVQVLKRRYEGKLDERADQFIGHAVEGAQRMQHLIQDLLAYSRVGTKGKPFVLLSLETVVNNALVNLSVAITESNAIIERDSLPELWGDAGQLAGVFQNLISNAIKFRGEAPPQIKIGCRADEHTNGGGKPAGWTFSVSDQGPGIEAQYFERIFVMFQRLHTRTEYAGTGIGLAIVKKIIVRHSGRIWVESVVGQGTTFFFHLPAHALQPDEPNSEGQAPGELAPQERILEMAGASHLSGGAAK